MNYYRAKCGLFYSESSGTYSCYGGTSHMGRVWDEDTGVILAHCPFDKDCTHRNDFMHLYPALKPYADCEIYTSKSYDFENSAEKIFKEYASQSYEKINARFGYACLAISPDGWGGYKVNYKPDNCFRCWAEICNVTGQKRNLEKVYLFGDIETVYIWERGFLKEEKKMILRKKVLKEPIPQEVAERILHSPKKSCLCLTFESNNTYGSLQDQDQYPVKRVRKYYAVPFRGKRDIMQDLADTSEGYHVQHESDANKISAQLKRERAAKRLQKKADKKQKIDKAKNIQQIQMEDIISQSDLT